MNQSKKSATLLFLLLSSFILGMGFILTQTNVVINSNKQIDLKDEAPRIAASLDESDYFLNASEIYRSIETVNITVNVSKFEGADDVDIIYTQNDIQIKDPVPMVPKANSNFTTIFNPRYDDPIGLIFITFKIYDGGTLLKTEEKITNITVKSNYILDLNDREFYKGDVMYGELKVNNISDTAYHWNVSVSSTEITTESQFNFIEFNLGYNITSFRFTINDTFTEGDADNYIFIELINQDTLKSYYISYDFAILISNTPPVINTTSITFNPEPLYRTKECNLTFNVDDAESPNNLDVSILIEGPNRELLEFENNDISDLGDGEFSVNFTISANNSIGSYEVEITAEDPAGATDTESAYLTVINNPPKINSFKINDKEINESITVNYGETLRFTFNLTDKEGLDYVTVALYNEQNNWFNITQNYVENMNLTIRTVDLAEGTWNVYIFVTDVDGDTSGLSEDYNIAPKQIKIVRRSIEGILPWLMLIMGLVFGGLISIGFASTWMKAKFSKSEVGKIKEGKKPKTPRKAKKTTKKEEPAKPEEVPSKEAEEEKKEKEEKKPTKRKIKRKL